MVIAGSGSGKTESVVRPYLSQFIEKGFCGILYDYKFPTLTNELNTILVRQQKRKKQGKAQGKQVDMPCISWILSVRNAVIVLIPFDRTNIKNISYAEEMATSIYHNLDISCYQESHGGKFFTQSAINWFTALIWFYKTRHPEQCTLPHVINTVLYPDFKHVFSMLLADKVAGDYIRSILTSLDANADRQLGGQVSSLQNEIVRLNTPALAWTLSGDDFDLNINDPENPKLLIGRHESADQEGIGPDHQLPVYGRTTTDECGGKASFVFDAGRSYYHVPGRPGPLWELWLAVIALH